MSFAKYNHPAILYDEVNLDKVEEISKRKEIVSYYVGFYRDGKLIKFDKYSGLTLNQYGVASPCRNICTVCGFVALS